MKKINHINGIVDCHTHSGGMDFNNFYNHRYPNTQDVSVLHGLISNNAVDYAVTFPMPSTIYYNTGYYWKEKKFVPSGTSNFPFEIENEFLLKEIKMFGFDNVLPFLAFSLQDKIEEQCIFLRTMIEKYPVYGLKYHTKADQNNIGQMKEKGRCFLNIAKEYNIPITFHTEKDGIASPMDIFELASLYPEVRFDMAHFAGFSKTFFQEYDEYNKNYGNVFIDSAPAIFLVSHISNQKNVIELDYSNVIEVLRFFLEKYHDNFLWGTDAPWLFASQLDEGIDGDVITYEDEVAVLKELKSTGISFSQQAINRFLFGVKKEIDYYENISN